MSEQRQIPGQEADMSVVSSSSVSTDILDDDLMFCQDLFEDEVVHSPRPLYTIDEESVGTYSLFWDSLSTDSSSCASLQFDISITPTDQNVNHVISQVCRGFLFPETLSPEPEMTLSPEPEMTLSPEPEMTLSSEPEMTLSSEPEMTLSPEPEMTLSPEPEMTLSSEPEMTLSSEPEMTLSPEPEMTLSPEPEMTLSSEPEMTLSSEPEMTLSPELEMTLSPEPEMTEMTLSSEPEMTEMTLSPETEMTEMTLSPEPEMTLSSEPEMTEMTLSPEPEMTLSSEPEMTLSPEPEMTRSSEPEMTLSPEPEMTLSSDPEPTVAAFVQIKPVTVLRVEVRSFYSDSFNGALEASSPSPSEMVPSHTSSQEDKDKEEVELTSLRHFSSVPAASCSVSTAETKCDNRNCFVRYVTNFFSKKEKKQDKEEKKVKPSDAKQPPLWRKLLSRKSRSISPETLEPVRA